ncbi:MAG: hypothetical protein ACRD8U_10075 [Pyrinomonadaceae bacterium]
MDDNTVAVLEKEAHSLVELPANDFSLVYPMRFHKKLTLGVSRA